MKCLSCGKEVHQVKGKQAKETCSSACRQALCRKKAKELSHQPVTSQPVTNPTCDSQPVTSDDLVIQDGEHTYTIKDGNKKVAERDKKGNIIQGSFVNLMSADQIAAELARQKVSNYPAPKRFDSELEVW